MTEHLTELARLRRALDGGECLVFDLDGTLYDTRDFERPALAAVCRWLRERSSERLTGAEQALWKRRESNRHRAGLFDDLLRRYDLPVSWGAECLDRFHAYPGYELAESDSLRPLLTELRARGRPLALVTNGWRTLQERKLESLRLGRIFERVVYCEPARPEDLKPSRWAWNELQPWRGTAAALYIGDDPVDAAFAASGDARFVEFRFRSDKYDD